MASNAEKQTRDLALVRAFYRLRHTIDHLVVDPRQVPSQSSVDLIRDLAQLLEHAHTRITALEDALAALARRLPQPPDPPTGS